MKVFKAAQIPQKPLNMLLYGPWGCGKTTFGATAPNALIVDYEYKAEKRLKIDFPDANIMIPDKGDSFESIARYAIEKHYGSLVIDTVDRLIAVLKYRRQGDRPNIKIQDWGIIMDEIKRPLLMLQAANIHVILNCHQTEQKVTELDPETNKETTILVARPNISTQLRDDIPAMVDIVGYMGKPKIVDGRSWIWVKQTGDRSRTPLWYCKTSWENMPSAVPPFFSSIWKMIDPDKPSLPFTPPSSPAAGAGPKLSGADSVQQLFTPGTNGGLKPGSKPLSELWDQFLMAEVLGDPDGKLWVMYLESMYGASGSADLTEEQAEELRGILDLSQSRKDNRREALYNFVKNHKG